MPTKKAVKKTTKKIVTKKVSRASHKSEAHFMKRHISVFSPLGIVLTLAFLVAAAAVAKAGYQAISAKPVSVNKVATTERTAPLTETVTGKVTRDLRDERGQSRYMLTTADGKKYELIGVNESQKIESLSVREAQIKYRNENAQDKSEETKMKDKSPKSSERPMPSAEVMAQNRRLMEQYVGKIVTVVGRSYGMSENQGNGKVAMEIMKFLVRSITLAQ